MFGCCVAGRPLQTNLQQIDQTHAAFELPQAESINHICVFLLGTIPFPDGYGATVHFFWPGKGFQLLGMLSNEKPSAIFRLRGTFTQQSTTAHAAFSSSSTASAASGSVTAVLGIAIEPLDQIMAQVQNLPSALAKAPPPPPDPTLLAEKIVKNLFNYVSGFVAGNSSGGRVTAESTVSMGLIARWYETFLGKVRAGGIDFLDRQE
ncbi:hypothetical protein EWM64_g2895 [Hericium alpestre]|uniref:Uncharacterized protein n=1 Tax=Hericium alpestre TaxID=135208 RepID=A0A4Z0A5C0_9AGAM|nr:hypothetical protein EWM64_g2895 [Hericium alpestre]